MKKISFFPVLILVICLFLGLVTACSKVTNQPENTSQTDLAGNPSSEAPTDSGEVPTKKPTEDQTETPTEKTTDESVSEIPGIELPVIWN